MSEQKRKVECVVVFSGGQDSTTCLGMAVRSFGAAAVRAITFTYGQKHAVEADCARRICERLGVQQQVVALDFLPNLVESALTSDGDVSVAHVSNPGLPASFVPNRNAMFLTLAHAYAQKLGARLVIGGMCETDYSGYPDCRAEFISQLERTLNLGSGASVTIETPLMHKTKAETFAEADAAGVLPLVLEESHTCYNGDHETRNAWGLGCGQCPACRLRARGWDEYKTGQA